MPMLAINSAAILLFPRRPSIYLLPQAVIEESSEGAAIVADAAGASLAGSVDPTLALAASAAK